jgi:hypothetical protein
MKHLLLSNLLCFCAAISFAQTKNEASAKYLSAFSCTPEQRHCKKAKGCCPEDFQSAASYVEEMNKIYQCDAKLIETPKKTKKDISAIERKMIPSDKCYLVLKSTGLPCASGTFARNFRGEYKICVSETSSSSKKQNSSSEPFR